MLDKTFPHLFVYSTMCTFPLLFLITVNCSETFHSTDQLLVVKLDVSMENWLPTLQLLKWKKDYQKQEYLPGNKNFNNPQSTHHYTDKEDL